MRIDIVSIFPMLVRTVGDFGVARIALERFDSGAKLLESA